MPSINELLGLLIALVVIWFILKMVGVAIRVILFILVVLLIVGGLAHLFMR